MFYFTCDLSFNLLEGGGLVEWWLERQISDGKVAGSSLGRSAAR